MAELKIRVVGVETLAPQVAIMSAVLTLRMMHAACAADLVRSTTVKIMEHVVGLCVIQAPAPRPFLAHL